MVDKENTYELDKRATELAVEEFQSTFGSVSASLEPLKKEMEEIKAELREERSKRKKGEAKARRLDQQLKYAQKNRFSDKRHNALRTRRRITLPTVFHPTDDSKVPGKDYGAKNGKGIQIQNVPC